MTHKHEWRLIEHTDDIAIFRCVICSKIEEFGKR